MRELITRLPAGTAGLGVEMQAYITAVDTAATGFLSASGDVAGSPAAAAFNAVP